MANFFFLVFFSFDFAMGVVVHGFEVIMDTSVYSVVVNLF